jgi:hypothetical protein
MDVVEDDNNDIDQLVSEPLGADKGKKNCIKWQKNCPTRGSKWRPQTPQAHYLTTALDVHEFDRETQKFFLKDKCTETDPFLISIALQSSATCLLRLDRQLDDKQIPHGAAVPMA